MPVEIFWCPSDQWTHGPSSHSLKRRLVQSQERVESKKEKKDSAMLMDALNQAGLSFQTYPAKVYISASVDELEKFLDTIRLFTSNSTSCQERGQTEWEKVESMIDEYVKKCYNPIKHQYVLVQEEDYPSL